MKINESASVALLQLLVNTNVYVTRVVEASDVDSILRDILTAWTMPVGPEMLGVIALEC